MLTLTNAFLQFGLEPATGAWRLQAAGEAGPRLEAARLGADYTVGEPGKVRRREWGGELQAVTVEPFVQRDAAQGQWQGHSVHGRLAADGSAPLTVTLDFALPADQPYRLGFRVNGAQTLLVNW